MARFTPVRFVLMSCLSVWSLSAAAQMGPGADAGAGGGVIGGVQAGPPPMTLPSAELPAVDPATAVTIEGRVVNAMTGQPVRQATLTLMLQPAGPGSVGFRGRPPMYSATSDAQGKFKFENLPPGRYQLSADKSGFVRASYGAEPGQPFSPLTAAASQKITDIEFKLTPQAVISGKVLDENGEPVANAAVRVTRRSGYFQQSNGGGNGVNTNAIGEFLVGGLAPGRYVLMVDFRPGRFGGPGGPAMMAATKTDTDSYVPTYYPSAIDAKAATPIAVGAGQEVRGIDVWLQKGRLYRISGRVAGQSAASGERVQVSIMRGGGNQTTERLMPFFGPQRNNSGGEFSFNSLSPGVYVVSAALMSPNSPPQPVGSATVTVAAKDIDGVVIQANPVSRRTITGSVKIEGAQSTPIAASVSLYPLEPVGPFRGDGATRTMDDGTFTIADVSPGKYGVNVSPLPQGSYLKRITAGLTDVLENGLDLLQAQAVPSLDILISPKAGAVAGVVKAGSDLNAGAFVTLLPQQLRPETQRSSKTARSDAAGHFSIEGVAPGEYRLYAWAEDIPLRTIQNEDLLPYESYGVSVRVEESAQKQTELQLVPLP